MGLGYSRTCRILSPTRCCDAVQCTLQHREAVVFWLQICGSVPMRSGSFLFRQGSGTSECEESKCQEPDWKLGSSDTSCYIHLIVDAMYALSLNNDSTPSISTPSRRLLRRRRISNMAPSLLQRSSEYYDVKILFVLAVIIALKLCIAPSVDLSHRSLSSCSPD